MAYTIYALILLLLITARFPVAGARQVITSGKHLSISQVKNPKWVPHQITTTELYAAPFLKHNLPMPPGLRNAVNLLNDSASILNARATGQTVNGSDGEYVFPVDIGNPPQTLHLVFDTGSGDFWVWSSEMSPEVLGSRARYNTSISTTAQLFTGQSFSAAYGSGYVSGVVWLDDVLISGDDGTVLVVTGNPIECAQIVGGSVSTLSAVDGILGLNRWVNDDESPYPQQTWLNYILLSGYYEEEVFTVALSSNGTGVIQFGHIDSAAYTGTIFYARVGDIDAEPTPGQWLFYMSGWAVGNNNMINAAFPVLVDSGTTVTLLPRSIASAYYAKVVGSILTSDGSWFFPCTSALPTFSFGVDYNRVTVRGSSLPTSSDIYCYGTIQPTDNGYAIFGTPFFYSLYIVHDLGNTLIGFAQRASLT